MGRINWKLLNNNADIFIKNKDFSYSWLKSFTKIPLFSLSTPLHQYLGSYIISIILTELLMWP